MLASAAQDYKINLSNYIMQQLGCVKTERVILRALVAISRSGADGFRARARAGVRPGTDPCAVPPAPEPCMLGSRGAQLPVDK